MPSNAPTDVIPVVDIPTTLNIASYFIDSNIEQGRGGTIAIYEEGRTTTYEQLAEAMNRAGNALRTLGVEQENRVLLAIPDSVEFVAVFFGAAKIGAIPIPVNTAAKPEDLLYFLNDSGARVLVVQDDLWPDLQPLLAQAPSLLHVLVMPSVPAQSQMVTTVPPMKAHYGFHRLSEALAAASPALAAEPTSKDDMAFFLYTSGSTGGPKGAVHLHHDMIVSTELYARNILKISAQDIFFSASKLFFAYGLGNGSYFAFAVGASVVYNPHRPKPETILEYIEKFRPTLFFSVPTLYAAMLQVPPKPDTQRNLSSVRYGVSAGEALPDELFHRFKERFSVEILDGIGSTEMLHIFISNRPGDIRPGTSGRIVPGYEARIVDEAGNALAPGDIGNLWVSGDSAAAFYWRKHGKSKATMVGEWLVTGDKYYVDPDGYFCYCGRADDMLKCSGQWVSPVEVENAIIAHPSVLESAIVGQADEDELVKPKVFIVLKNGATAPNEDDLRTFLKGKLAGYKIPRWVEIVPELPKTATGKIQRFKLRS
ncbi:MAG: benzoate-CoA ligase family protein [Acidobacteria bacterium]|nr:benzoate-CoA ligase family protein [Acidobacteriota bacterium]